MKTKLFEEYFNTKCSFKYSSPARINLIGEHIDYNGGYVLPACISLYTDAYVSQRDDDIISLRSTSFEDTINVSFNDLEYNESRDWANYPIGIFYLLKKSGYKIDKGLNILFDSNIPLGSGLSSSASILDLTCYLLSDIYNLGLTREEIVKIAVNCENSYCKLSCGIMDEAIISLGQKNKCLLLDCANFKYSYHDMDLKDYCFVVLKTNKKRKLTESKYNERVEECNKGLNILKKHYNISNLCQLDNTVLNDVKEYIKDETIYKRVKHVITENQRVKDFIKALENNDIIKLGNLLNESDLSLKDDYCVTGLHLDTITSLARKYNAVGSRMTGAGFGGCAIALIKKDEFDSFKENVIKDYYTATNIMCDVLKVDIVDGVKKVN